MKSNPSACAKCYLQRQRAIRGYRQQREEIMAYVVNELLTIKEEIFDLMYEIDPFYEPPVCDTHLSLQETIRNYKAMLYVIMKQLHKRNLTLNFPLKIKEELAKDHLIGLRYAIRYHVDDKILRNELRQHEDFVVKFLATCDLCKKPGAAETLVEKSKGAYLTELTFLADCAIYDLTSINNCYRGYQHGLQYTDTYTLNSCVTTLDIFNF